MNTYEYEVIDLDNNIIYTFESYTEMRDTMEVEWDYDEEMYIIQSEEYYEEDDELSAFLDSCVNVMILPDNTTNEL